MKTYIIVPEEILTSCQSALDDMNITYQNIVYYGLDLIRPSHLRPNYQQALNELDLWHDLHIWSNAPAMIPTANITTQQFINCFKPVGSTRWEYLIAPFIEELANATNTDKTQILNEFRNGQDDEYKEIMNSLRSQYRLDKIATQN